MAMIPWGRLAAGDAVVPDGVAVILGNSFLAILAVRCPRLSDSTTKRRK